MSQQPGDTEQTRWARERLRGYLLDTLDDGDADRFAELVAAFPSLVYDIEDAEQRLIGEWLDGTLSGADAENFRRQYVEGDERNRARLALYQAIRSAPPEIQPAVPPRPVLVSRPSRWIASGAAASLLAAAGVGFLAYSLSNENRRLKADLAKALSPAPPRPEAPPELPAGLSPEGGVTLAVADTGKTLTVSETPRRLIWTPVPDYRAQYRISVQPAAGRLESSPLLTPRDNAIEYPLPAPASLTLPWQVSVAGADGAVVARYIIRQP